VKTIVPIGLAMRSSRASFKKWKAEHLAGRSLHSQLGTEVVFQLKREGRPIRQVSSATLCEHARDKDHPTLENVGCPSKGAASINFAENASGGGEPLVGN